MRFRTCFYLITPIVRMVGVICRAQNARLSALDTYILITHSFAPNRTDGADLLKNVLQKKIIQLCHASSCLAHLLPPTTNSPLTCSWYSNEYHFALVLFVQLYHLFC